MGLPLSKIKVLEIGTLIAAPFATRILAEFGADVIKIEPVGTGDPLRKWRKLHNGTSLWWYLQSRNKKSLALNLKSLEAIELIKKIIAETDVLVENMRPGALENLGLSWEVLKQINPKLTFVRISGYGQTGPYKDKPGFGAIGEAMGGIRYTTGSPETAPARVGVSIGDSLASLHAVIGALISIINIKTNDGEGQIVDVSLAESVFNIMESIVPEYDLDGFIRERTGGSLPGIAPSNTYRTRDNGFLVIAGNSDPIFKRLMIAIGRSELADNPEFAQNDGRAKQSQYLDEVIESWTKQHAMEDALTILEAAEVPCGRIYSVADIVKDPQFQAREMLLKSQLPDGQMITMPGIVPKLSATPGQVNWHGPSLGEHTQQILEKFGYQPEQISDLNAKGVIQSC